MRKLSKMWLLSLLPIIALPVVYFYVLSIRNKGPEQPILFSHKIHAGQDQIPCQYCHSFPTKSRVAGMPSIQKCIGCHQIIAGQDSEYYFGNKIINIKQEIQKLRDYWAKTENKWLTQNMPSENGEPAKDFNYLGQKEPIPWVRVYYLPEHVHFNHKRHILRGFECKTCHGDVATMDQLYPVQKVEMGWCVGCHEKNARNEDELVQLKDCLTCHY